MNFGINLVAIIEGFDLVAFMKALQEFLLAIGYTNGLFALFFIGAQVWIYREYQGRLADRQKEIERLAEENREYRERFLQILDKHHKLKPTKPKANELTEGDSQ